MDTEGRLGFTVSAYRNVSRFSSKGERFENHFFDIRKYARFACISFETKLFLCFDTHVSCGGFLSCLPGVKHDILQNKLIFKLHKTQSKLRNL
jgi:hypothetical protein